MTDTKYIQGAGGGGGKGGGGGNRTPTEADDTLQSVQFGNVLDLLSEGEIQGLDDGLKSIFLDDTPLQNASGQNNFSGYTVYTRTGTQSQSHIPGPFNAVEREVPVGVDVLKATPVTRTINDTTVDRVRITLTIPALQKIEEDGDIKGSKVTIQIQIAYDGGGFNTVINDTISGKSSNRYQRDYLINLSSFTSSASIKFIRVSDDETSSKRASSTIFQSYTEIIDDKFRYPNSAIVGLRFDSRQFQSIPRRKYLIRGIKVKIPSNATVDTTTFPGRITYSGIWDGTFQAATWCSDPAWVLHDLLTSSRYGAGVPESSLDKYDFFAISQYCNQLVDNGEGGQEPRFSTNILINSRDEVYNVIQQMTAIFRGIAYYSAGTLTVLQDKPTDSQYLIGQSNVVEGIFQYQGTSQKARHSVAVVAWQSYDTLGDVEYEYVEDSAAVAKYGIIKKDIKAIGCYSQGQANRIGKWALLSEQNLTETVQFSVSLESGIILRPGMVIDVADPARAGSRRSGRIKSAHTTQVTVDSSTDLSPSVAAQNSPKLSVMLPTGVVETRDIPVGGIHPKADGTCDIDVTSAFSQSPVVNSVFMVQTTDLLSQQFRVVSVSEAEEGIYGVSAVAYNGTIYDAVESDLELTTRDVSNLSAIPNPVDSIEAEEFLYEEASGVFVGALVSWVHDRKNIVDFRVQYRIDEDNWETVQTAAPSITLRNLRAGTLYVQVSSRNYLNKTSQVTTASFVLQGKTAVPSDVTGFSMIPVNGQARLSWNQAPDLDVRVGGVVRLRHSPDFSNVTWSGSTSISDDIAGSSTETYEDLKPGTYSIKFIDSGGRESKNAALIEFTKADLDNVQNVGTQTEDSSFPGSKTNLEVDADTNELLLARTGVETASIGELLAEDDSLVLLEDGTNAFALQGDDILHTSGEYYFQNNPITLSDVFSIKLDSTIRARAFLPYGFRLDSQPNFDAIVDFDGAAPTKADVQLYIRTTQDDPAGSPTWTSYRRFNNAEFKARAYELKAVFSTNASDEQIAVDQLRVEANMPIRTITGSVTTSASADVSVAYGTGNKFYVAPSVGIVFTANSSGDYYVVSNSTATGFDVSVYNSSNTRIAKTVNWTATGYGKG